MTTSFDPSSNTTPNVSQSPTSLDAARELQPYLSRGETLVWSGRPAQGLAFQAIDIFAVPFSVLWAGLAVTSFLHMPVKGAGAFAAIPALFVVVGFYITVGRFLLDAWLRARTAYGVTSSRVIIVSTAFRTSITSYDIDRIATLRLAETSGGRGTITFREPVWPYHNANVGFYTSGASSSLFRIAGAKAVFDLIRGTPRAEVQPR